jgi:hypothetical protein
MMGVAGVSWKERTGVHSPKFSKPENHQGTREDWIHTRNIILKVVRRFPEVIGAVREALHAGCRPVPEELRVPS